ncbi:hypothetical protein MSAN_00829800 [Mycena sanguinolenta]|uniref:Uncharacterized protein n=1 Tax=Mycena sanguinolenta TaxID=230812 RepID=A0A8H7DDK9_9AGAR|nr:hypothetical protein MSAN_00829800 [Mycena sanguinolenta]
MSAPKLEAIFGAPLVCNQYDLADALRRENEARILREDSGLDSDEEDVELEDPVEVPLHAPPLPAPLASSTTSALTGLAKKNHKKRERQRTKRRESTVAAMNSPTPPVPAPHVLEKAAASTSINVAYSANSFRATKQCWVGPTKPFEHPLLAHAADAEFLKQHMPYFDWDGIESHVLVDCHGRSIGLLVGVPEMFADVIEAASDACRAAREKMLFPASAYIHRRASGPGFPTSTRGFGFGTGRQTVGNYKACSRTNEAAMGELLANDAVNRAATFPIPAFQAVCWNIFSDYHATKQTLLNQNPGLHRTFERSPFAAVTANLGPFSVSPPHTDGANKADGMCLITALGRFNADKGAHLVLWDYNFIIRFPAGCSAFIPSAVVTHSNTPIADDEERFSLVQYSAGALLRWVDNGFKSDLTWMASATPADLARREENRKARCAAALKKFSLWKDVKVKNFSGRGRVEVWDQGDIADFNDLTEEEDSDVEEPPRKKRRM